MIYFPKLIDILTKAEHEVLYYLLKGSDDSEIAKLLYKSPVTIRKHKSNICKKLECENKLRILEDYKHLLDTVVVIDKDKNSQKFTKYHKNSQDVFLYCD